MLSLLKRMNSLSIFSGSTGQRVMVRTCNGLELREAGPYSDSEDLVDDPTGVFPSASSRDELTPR